MTLSLSHGCDAARLLPTSADPSAQLAGAHAYAAIAIEASADRVWRVLTAIDDWPRWNPAVSVARLTGSITPGTVFRWKSHGFMVTSTFGDVEARRRLVWTGRALGTRACHAWEIAPDGNGVIVRTAETFDGWLPRLMPRAMQKMLDSTLPAWLAALKAEAESTVAPWAGLG